MDLPRLALIAGSGVEAWAHDAGRPLRLDTPYGRVEGSVNEVRGHPFVAVRRHGEGHAAAPHRVNYRAIAWALWKWGCRRAVGTAAVGAITPGLSPGSMHVVDDFIDLTHGRPHSFFDHTAKVRHVDMTRPYCPSLQEGLELALGGGAQRVVYAVTQGPRFETAAEIRALGRLGADVVGQTQAPEAALLREAGICYAAVAIVTNPAAGLASRPLDEREVYARLDAALERFRDVFGALLEGGAAAAACPDCGAAGGLDGI